jgi:hypothetical protein
MDIVQIEVVLFVFLAQKSNYKIFSVSIKDIDQHLNKERKSKIDLRETLLKEYWEYLDVFSKRVSDKLSFYRLCNYYIELEEDPNKVLRNPPLYQMSIEELKIVKKYLEDNLKKEFI